MPERRMSAQRRMGQEINEGIAYLLALKQTGQPGGAAASPAREMSAADQAATTSVAPRAGDHLKGAEKRRSARYKCEGSTAVWEEGSDVRTWAAFTDVSLHGCYVETQATYPAGTILHLKLEANGVRVECMGTVRVSYPHLGMGIYFQNMSEETKVHLRQLLATFSRHCIVMSPGIAPSLPGKSPREAIPLISDPTGAMQALIEFFQSHQMLMREDFLRLVRKSQSKR